MARDVIPLKNLIEQFERMPGIGHKSAQKLAFYILGMSDADAKRLADNILLAKEKIHRCKVCCDLTDSDVCSICGSVAATMPSWLWTCEQPPAPSAAATHSAAAQAAAASFLARDLLLRLDTLNLQRTL